MKYRLVWSGVEYKDYMVAALELAWSRKAFGKVEFKHASFDLTGKGQKLLYFKNLHRSAQIRCLILIFPWRHLSSIGDG